jgi:hypothetical protein
MGYGAGSEAVCHLSDTQILVDHGGPRRAYD